MAGLTMLKSLDEGNFSSANDVLRTVLESLDSLLVINILVNSARKSHFRRQTKISLVG